jgi:nucleoside 2-deoxyribosyltransferase
VLAILDGVDVDSGTASEIGYACARGKLIVGYRGDLRLSGDNLDSRVNIQVEYFIRDSGGEVFASVDYPGSSDPAGEALERALEYLCAQLESR